MNVPGKSGGESQRRREYIRQPQYGDRRPQPQPKGQVLGDQGMVLAGEEYPVRRARSGVNRGVKRSDEGQQRPQSSPGQGRGAKQQKKKKQRLPKMLQWLSR